MTNESIKKAFERMWLHTQTAISNKFNEVAIPIFNLIDMGVSDLYTESGIATASIDTTTIIETLRLKGSIKLTFLYNGEIKSLIFFDISEGEDAVAYSQDILQYYCFIFGAQQLTFSTTVNLILNKRFGADDAGKILEVNNTGILELTEKTTTITQDDGTGNVIFVTSKLEGGNKSGTGFTNLFDNSLDLILRASTTSPSTPGNLLFQNSAGAELGRIWLDAANSSFKVRFGASDTVKTLLHSGNIGTTVAPAYNYQETDPGSGSMLETGKMLIIY